MQEQTTIDPSLLTKQGQPTINPSFLTKQGQLSHAAEQRQLGHAANSSRRRQPRKGPSRPKTSAAVKAQKAKDTQKANELEQFANTKDDFQGEDVTDDNDEVPQQSHAYQPNQASHDQSLDVQRARQDSASSSDDALLALYQAPDLELLPVANTPQNKQKFEFYIKSFVTSILEVQPESMGSYSEIVHRALQDPMLFTVSTTVSEASRWRMISLTADPPESVVHGYGKTLAMLTERLASQKFAFTNVVLLTMALLAAVETMIKNVSATGRHLAGMQSVMAERAKAAAPSTAGPLVQVVNVWGEYFKQREITMQMYPPWTPLRYPSLPFGSDLNMQIAELPVGFMDVSLSGQISEQLLDVLTDFTAYFKSIAQKTSPSVADSQSRMKLTIQQANICITFVQNKRLNLTEQIICAALIAHVTRRDRLHPSLMNLRNYFQLFCGFLCTNLTKDKTNLPIKRENHDNEFMKWAGAILLLTSAPTAQARQLALKLLPRRPQPAKVLKVCEKFFWDDALSKMLLEGTTMVFETSNDTVANSISTQASDD